MDHDNNPRLGRHNAEFSIFRGVYMRVVGRGMSGVGGPVSGEASISTHAIPRVSAPLIASAVSEIGFMLLAVLVTILTPRCQTGHLTPAVTEFTCGTSDLPWYEVARGDQP
ncbi:hypothetical protein H7H78_12690 [Mycobacterium shinjukuense]|uniref:Uncharacterized protein n=1 Tax=Mycobacterium shinjukuense TaxID=398694 RepID=A0A7I7MSS9_9MYCO|nr:hypothetical protein [Mycobacterium shinjukuense]MCV6986257.1 hypothetical protein [Mycobacterium shinjukuense]BBX75245.1 hypothetical protein MSHI_31510 [Mycobacterium shinjukuense]